MPLYDLKCPKCNAKVEKVCSFEQSSKVECPECGVIMERQVAQTGGFKIYGYSMDNGYSKDNLSYDGNPNPQW